MKAAKVKPMSMDLTEFNSEMLRTRSLDVEGLNATFKANNPHLITCGCNDPAVMVVSVGSAAKPVCSNEKHKRAAWVAVISEAAAEAIAAMLAE